MSQMQIKIFTTKSYFYVRIKIATFVYHNIIT